MSTAEDFFARDERADSRKQLPEEVADYLREQIMSGAFKPGEFLRMDRIAAAVGVSNTPVREALMSLRGEGLVRLLPRRGFVVAPFTRQDVRDLFATQAHMAGELAARAAEKITSEQIAELEAVNEKFERAIATGNTDLIGSLGHTFHRAINVAADSNRLAFLLASVVNQLPNRFYATLEAQVEASTSQHPLLIDALSRRQSRVARALMEDHIVESADYVIEMLEQRGLWDR
ncbi:GntR family transcriptional regulator [Skermania sp. ID1734]|uniref:GntR family transcriptional regulator n=1 Tax=Skermania sp. ID1734 TaxID=2597516 RepID=UPI00117D5A06|nr:GntR family transcriptional regulator [Skermania sp. ID1734]TSD92962.1 GntR family transcriptional regulator [Skermania sp. ID1734]